MRPATFSRGVVRWLLPVALLALTPKCVLCVLAYMGVGMVLGLGGPELCGAPQDAPVSWVTTLAWVGVAGVVGVLVVRASCWRLRSMPEDKSNRW